MLPLFAHAGGLRVFVACPLPGRGPRLFQRRDPWRGFKFAARRTVMDRADGGKVLGFWRGDDAEPMQSRLTAYRWSRSGPTVSSNNQALYCAHNQRKSNLRPPWWYVLSLDRGRAGYMNSATDARGARAHERGRKSCAPSLGRSERQSWWEHPPPKDALIAAATDPDVRSNPYHDSIGPTRTIRWPASGQSRSR